MLSIERGGQNAQRPRWNLAKERTLPAATGPLEQRQRITRPSRPHVFRRGYLNGKEAPANYYAQEADGYRNDRTRPWIGWVTTTTDR